MSFNLPKNVVDMFNKEQSEKERHKQWLKDNPQWDIRTDPGRFIYTKEYFEKEK